MGSTFQLPPEASLEMQRFEQTCVLLQICPSAPDSLVP
jgi:hypothetical protein